MPNTLAYIALLIWPLVVIVMFRKMAPERAFIWAILGGYMALPEMTQINFPMIPPFDKVSIPNLTAFMVCVILLKMRFRLMPEFLLARVFMLCFLIAPVLVVFTNTDPIYFGTTQSGQMTLILADVEPLPGMRLYDSVSTLARSLLLILPFFMARQLLASATAMTEILRALVIAALIYSGPMLWEVLFSPQLHTKFYGFFQHDFSQMIRDGGFRPIVFMPHGLWVALFAASATIAAFHFALQAAPNDRPRAYVIVFYLFVVAYFCRSLGPLMIMLSLAAALVLLSKQMQLRLAAAMGGIAMIFPLLRGAGLVPTEAYVAFLEPRRPDRAHSLNFRFENEDILLERAAEKPLFGWGGWGRNLGHDPMTGEAVTISDGQWIITIGQFGWVGYIGTFGLLALPVIALWWQYRRVPNAQIAPQIGVVALLLGANLIDLLPNATLIPLTWLMAGALLGQAELQRARNRDAHRDKVLAGLSRDGLLGTARLTKTSAPHSAKNIVHQDHRL